jgi:predicted O-methyltransferase YrrM
MNWDDCYQLTKDINNHYGMWEEHYKMIYDTAIQCPPKSTFLELGVCHGRSAAVLCCVAKILEADYYGIDNFGLEGSAEEVRETLKSRGLEGHIIESSTHDYPWDQMVDLLFIDAGHDEDNVSRDCEKYIPFVKSGGYILFDDWDDPFDQSSAHWAVHHYGNLYTKNWKQIDMWAGLNIRQKP